MQIKKIRELKDSMTSEQKRRLLIGLRKLKEEYTGNVGGETDIMNADNLQTNENEFTGGETKPEPKVIAKTFDTTADFLSYVQQRRGIEMTSKEQQTIISFKGATPTQRDRFMVKYESTDPFGVNDTTIIKKLRDPNSEQFCWTAFSTHQSAEDEGKPGEKDEGSGKEDKNEELPGLKEQTPAPASPNQPAKPANPPQHTPSEPEEDDDTNQGITVEDNIRVSKSITFTDEMQGADILSKFLQALDL